MVMESTALELDTVYRRVRHIGEHFKLIEQNVAYFVVEYQLQL